MLNSKKVQKRRKFLKIKAKMVNFKVFSLFWPPKAAAKILPWSPKVIFHFFSGGFRGGAVWVSGGGGSCATAPPPGSGRSRPFSFASPLFAQLVLSRAELTLTGSKIAETPRP